MGGPGSARDHVWNIEGLYFSLDEALGLFGLLLQFIVHLLSMISFVLRIQIGIDLYTILDKALY